MTRPAALADGQIRAKALEAVALVGPDDMSVHVTRIAARLRDLTRDSDNNPLPLATLLPYVHWAIDQGRPSQLAIALRAEFTDEQLAELAGAIDLGPEGESPAWDRLLEALIEAQKVS